MTYLRRRLTGWVANTYKTTCIAQPHRVLDHNRITSSLYRKIILRRFNEANDVASLCHAFLSFLFRPDANNRRSRKSLLAIGLGENGPGCQARGTDLDLRRAGAVRSTDLRRVSERVSGYQSDNHAR